MERSEDNLQAGQIALSVSSIVVEYIKSGQILMSPEDVERLTRTIWDTFNGNVVSAKTKHPAKNEGPLTFIVPVEDTVHHDYIISLEDGKPYKSLKHHLGYLGMTPDDYRRKWGLPSDYPMLTKASSDLRRENAKRNDFGSKGGRKRK